jgi:predicted nuclease of predicted toxin-antitoxin system
MKLLFDHNLSPKLIRRLVDLFPESAHVADLGLDRATDLEVWNQARTGGYLIVTKDSDFNDLAVLRGFPPKVVWLQLGNCTTRHIEMVLRRNADVLTAFVQDSAAGVLEIFG